MVGIETRDAQHSLAIPLFFTNTKTTYVRSPFLIRPCPLVTTDYSATSRKIPVVDTDVVVVQRRERACWPRSNSESDRNSPQPIYGHTPDLVPGSRDTTSGKSPASSRGLLWVAANRSSRRFQPPSSKANHRHGNTSHKVSDALPTLVKHRLDCRKGGLKRKGGCGRKEVLIRIRS